MRIPRKHFPPGLVREVKQWSPGLDGYDQYRWDFAWRDPANGRTTQYTTMAYCRDDTPEEIFAQAVRGPALACIEREIHRKCGMDYAIKNQHPLSLPRTGCVGRFV